VNEGVEWETGMLPETPEEGKVPLEGVPLEVRGLLLPFVWSGAAGDAPLLGELSLPGAEPDVDSSAKPIDRGEYRKTEYTFLRNVSPTIQEGVLDDPPRSSSNRAPMHIPCPTDDSSKSALLMLHIFDPNPS